MSAREVRDRLADRFRLLKGPEPGPDRQQTLRHAVGWSYDLLTDDERDLLRITSVFAADSTWPASSRPSLYDHTKLATYRHCHPGHA